MFACGMTSLCELLTIVPTRPCSRTTSHASGTWMQYKMLTMRSGYCKPFESQSTYYSIEISNMRPFFDASEHPRADLFKSTSRYHGLQNNCTFDHGLREHMPATAEDHLHEVENHDQNKHGLKPKGNRLVCTERKSMSTTMARNVSKAHMTSEIGVTISIRELETTSC